ncbi:hypothetical protein [Anaerosporobacter sp.]
MGAINDMIKWGRSKTVFIMLSSIFMILFTGCGDKYPPTEQEVFSYIRENYGGSCKLISTEKKQDTEEESEITIYHFQSEFGFDFDVEGGLDYNPPGLFPAKYSKYIYTDYMEKLQDFIADDIKILSDKYASGDIKITTEDEGYSISVTFQKYNNIRTVYEFVYELRLLYGDKYKVKDEGLSNINITMYKDDKQFYSTNLSWINKLDKEKSIEYLQLFYVEGVRQEEYIDATVDEDMLTNMPRIVIEELVINGNQYTSKKYDPQFVYSVDEQEWLTLVGYGVILDYNGNVQDYMQREIITEYLDGDYDIDNENNITRYTISNDSYEVYFPFDDEGIKDEYYFMKNNQKLNIKLSECPSLWGDSEANYFAYIKLSDWAELLNMDYTVDNKEGVVILNSK